MDKRRVVVTGIGAITPIGSGRDGLWEGVRRERSAVQTITRFDPSAFRSQVAAQVNDFDPLDYMDRKQARRLDRFSQFGLAAARQAVASAGLSPRDIDLVVFATVTPDTAVPSNACRVQGALGCRPVAAFDVAAACTGFVQALTIASQFIGTGACQNVLVIGAEVLSRTLDFHDRSSCILFGDGAGAVVLRPSEHPGILSSHLHADGSHHGILSVPGQVYQGGIQGRPFVHMDGGAVFRFAVKVLAEVAQEALAANAMDGARLDWLIPHQANIRIIEATAKKLHLPMERVVVTVDRHGNTSAASVPMALDEAVRDGRIRPGQHVLLEGVGGGFTWGAVLLKY